MRKLLFILVCMFIFTIPCYAIEEVYIDKDTGNSSEMTFDEDNLKEDIRDNDYVIVSENEDYITAVSKYAAKTIVVDADIKSYKDAIVDKYKTGSILIFKTEKETEEAYKELSKQYDVFLDIPVKAEGCWGKSFMGLDVYNTMTSNSNENVCVAVLDSGVDNTHSAFNGRKVTHVSLSDVSSYFEDFKETSDDNGHGTAVAGVIANSTPKNVSIMSIKIADSQGYTTVYRIEKGTEYAAQNGADIINVSYGAYLDKDIYRDKILNPKSQISDWAYEYKNAAQKGITICVSSGNETLDIEGEQYVYPACIDSVLAIGAIDKEGKWAYYSNYGNQLDFVAPGDNVSVPWLKHKNAIMSGTSFASPYIAAYCANVKLQDKDISCEEMQEVLKKVSVDLGPKGKDRLYGYGCPKYDKDYNLLTRSVQYSINNYYTGKVLKPKTTISNMKEGINYKVSYSSNLNVGTGKVKITAIAPFSGSVTKEFRILPRAITPMVTLSSKKYTYDGKNHKPTVTVKDGKKVIKDYDVIYPNDLKSKGSHKITIKLKKNYSGTKSVSYVINPPKPTVHVVRKNGKTYLTFTKGCQIKYNGKFYKVSGKKKTFKGFYKAKIRKYEVISGKTYYSEWVTK